VSRIRFACILTRSVLAYGCAPLRLPVQPLTSHQLIVANFAPNVSNRPLTDRRAFLLEGLQCSG
jgi:hypothetical protein